MQFAEILAILASVLKICIIFNVINTSDPSEKRRESLAQLDAAIISAHKKDLTDLSKWIGSRT